VLLTQEKLKIVFISGAFLGLVWFFPFPFFPTCTLILEELEQLPSLSCIFPFRTG